MNTYSVSFIGRQSGAIGIVYKINDQYEAADIHELMSLLYEDYDLTNGVEVRKNGEVVEIPKDIKWVKVRSHRKRKRKDDMATYITPCTLID